MDLSKSISENTGAFFMGKDEEVMPMKVQMENRN